MRTFWSSFRKNGRKTYAALSCILIMGLSFNGCTSSRDSPALESPEPNRVYRATPTVRQMNEQSSTVNRKINIEARSNDPAMRTPTERTQRVLPGRQPVRPDTASTRTRRDSTRRRQ